MEALPALGVLLAAVLGRLCSLHEAEITRNCCEGIFEIQGLVSIPVSGAAMSCT